MQATINWCCISDACRHVRCGIWVLLQEDVAAQEQAAQQASVVAAAPSTAAAENSTAAATPSTAAAAPSTAAAAPSTAAAATSTADVEGPVEASLADLSLQSQDDIAKPVHQQTTSVEQNHVVTPAQHQVSPLQLAWNKVQHGSGTLVKSPCIVYSACQAQPR